MLRKHRVEDDFFSSSSPSAEGFPPSADYICPVAWLFETALPTLDRQAHPALLGPTRPAALQPLVYGYETNTLG